MFGFINQFIKLIFIMFQNLFKKNNSLPTAGKVTILTAVTGVLLFAFVFLFNAGKTELMKVEAQTATTTLTVLNIPPFWVADAEEEFESSSANPTNSETTVSWVATADKSSGAPYFLLICSTATEPIPHPAPDLLSLGTVQPTCADGTQWAVSTGTVANTQARAATTTLEVWAESNDWYAWICDDDPITPRCNSTFKQGTGNFASPFVVNHRPLFTAITSDSPKNPGEVISFFSTSSDPDTLGGPDDIRLVICAENDFNPTIADCTSGSLASTTGSVQTDAFTSFTLPIPARDDIYDAFAFVIDQHNHTATGSIQASNVGFTVSNVAPHVLPGDITLNDGNPIILTQAGSETVGFELTFKVSDNNSCMGVGSAYEITDFIAAVHRSGVATTTCDGSAGSYEPNSCYPSQVDSAIWNLSCTPDYSACLSDADVSITYNCSFPLWYIADPTDAVSVFNADGWVASISGVDDNNATGTLMTGATGVTLQSFMAMNITTEEIPYGALEPGQNTGTLKATTTMVSLGNTGLNQEIKGDAMCPGYTPSTPCDNNPASTIPDNMQQFGASVLPYGSGIALSSSTPQGLALKIPKTIATSSPQEKNTYWGIAVPAAISISGDYTGMNTFYGVISSSTDW